MQITSHPLRRMDGRDPHEPHRAATPLELLYDLTLVVAFGVAGEQLAHTLAEGHLWEALVGFAFSMYAVVWCWINDTWLASAYDTDDWFVRVAVIVQMAGVLTMALGLPDAFAGLMDGWQLHDEVVVRGYVLLAPWLPVAVWERSTGGDL